MLGHESLRFETAGLQGYEWLIGGTRASPGSGGGSGTPQPAKRGQKYLRHAVAKTRTLNCPYCKRPLTEIDYYGELIIGCIECNRWGRPGDKKLIMQCWKLTLRR